MIQDYSLAIFANLMGITIFLLIMVYHYVMVNTPKKYARVKIA